jgi:hypothetical protein
MPSSVIHSMQYFPDRHTLRIVFVSGMVYDYDQVPVKVYDQMKAAFSKGEFFNREIKDKYTFKKIH